jgi:hypothetical protein
MVVLLAVDRAPGQPQGRGPVRGGPNAVVMLRHKAVQEELKLTKDQLDQLKALMTGMRDKMLELVENGERDKVPAVVKGQEKGLTKILTAGQYKRLQEVVLQVHGLWALTEPDTARKLKVTPGQMKKLRELQAETEKQMKNLPEGAATRTEVQKKMDELHRAANDKGLLLLTDEQRARWKALTGEPFKGEIKRVTPGGPRGRP